MLERVVVPLDGSKLAEVALPYAEEISAKIGAEITLLTVLATESPEEHEKHRVYSTRVVDATRRHIEKYLDKSSGVEVKVDAATRSGDPAMGILDYIGSGMKKLVVMATHGRSGIGRWAVGSVADKVVRSTSRQPLLIIRAKGGHPDIRARRIFKKALVPLDGSVTSEAVVSNIVEIAGPLKMEIFLLRVVNKANHRNIGEAEEYLQEWYGRVAAKGIAVKPVVRSGTPADVIIDFADEQAVDMVAMATHGQNSLNIWPLGSVAQKLLLGGNTPLLLIRA